MSNYHRIDGCNMVNGRGIRTVIWLSGCPHHCKGCFSPQTWNEKGGIPFDEEAYNEVIKCVSEPYCDGITICGGEPLAPFNVEVSTRLAKDIKAMGKTVWCYSGYYYEEVEDLEIMKYIDVLIDGRFILKQFNSKLKWRGSANQRVIDVQATRQQGSIVLHPDSNTVDEYHPEEAYDPCKDMTPQEIKEKYIDNVCNEGEL